MDYIERGLKAAEHLIHKDLSVGIVAIVLLSGIFFICAFLLALMTLTDLFDRS